MPAKPCARSGALALDGDSPSALNGLGLLHADAGRSGEAAAAFERAATLDQSNASYWTNLETLVESERSRRGGDRLSTSAPG